MKFAHMADIHIGANREPTLAKLEAEAFSQAIDKCIECKVDFIIIAGDLFQSGIPDLSAVDGAVKNIRRAQEAGIPIYVIYGSHDYNPNGTSIIDILDSTGLIERIVKAEMDQGRLKLKFFTDPKTGAKMTGISARKAGLESKYYEILDRESLEKEEGFKIFVFHSGLTELKPAELGHMESIPLSYLPKAFDYYAGGHVHESSQDKWPGYGDIVFPGTLFAGSPRDFEATAKGTPRGFYIVHFDKKIEKLEFIPIVACDAEYHEYDLSNMNSTHAQSKLRQSLNELDVKGKLLVLKVFGELAGGKTSDLELPAMKATLIGKGAVDVYFSRSGLTSKDYRNIKTTGEDSKAIEHNLFKENIGALRLTNKELTGTSGVKLAEQLLETLRQEQRSGEIKKGYESRIKQTAAHELHLEDAN
jgi:DNA repair protein SbcD/Mre11